MKGKKNQKAGHIIYLNLNANVVTYFIIWRGKDEFI